LFASGKVPNFSRSHTQRSSDKFRDAYLIGCDGEDTWVVSRVTEPRHSRISFIEVCSHLDDNSNVNFVKFLSQLSELF
jgi:hypothetical protein